MSGKEPDEFPYDWMDEFVYSLSPGEPLYPPWICHSGLFNWKKKTFYEREKSVFVCGLNAIKIVCDLRILFSSFFSNKIKE